LRDERYIYLCFVEGMEQNIDAAFAEICAQYAVYWQAMKITVKKVGACLLKRINYNKDSLMRCIENKY
jgi:hypothetical protein